MSHVSRAPGEVIAGRYQLKSRLAEGGIGEVWLAEHIHLKQEVAIKFLKEAFSADPEASADILERFRFESQVSALVGRKTIHVVTVYDAGESEVGPFLAMEYVPGRSLAGELAAHGPMTPSRFGAILTQVADALGVVHAAGIVHRDIKPANMLVSDEADGSLLVKLADFGIAKTTNLALPLDRPKDTVGAMIVGTLDFMSPEQLQGGKAHPAMDVWALGVVAYELLTGVLPFEARSKVDMIVKILHGPFPAVSSVRSSLPQGLDAWFSRALAKAPNDRFMSVKEMNEAYWAVIDGPEAAPAVSADPASRHEPARFALSAAARLAAENEEETSRHVPPIEARLTDGRRRAVVAGVALATLLTAGLLLRGAVLTKAGKGRISEEIAAIVEALRPSGQPSGEPPVATAPDVWPDDGGQPPAVSVALPPHESSSAPSARGPRARSALATAPPSSGPLPASATAPPSSGSSPGPAASPAPRKAAPKPLDPSSVF